MALAGLITGIRTLATKKGDQMAFVPLEDLQGGCEVVFFPKAYVEWKDKLAPDTVVIVKGKAQTRDGRTSLLADAVQTHVDKISAWRRTRRGCRPASSTAAPRSMAGLSATVQDTDENGADNGEDNGADDADRQEGVHKTTWHSSPGWAVSAARMISAVLIPALEENPFRDEIPGWLRDQGAPPPLPVTPAPRGQATG